jgi:hypothetical protein
VNTRSRAARRRSLLRPVLLSISLSCAAHADEFSFAAFGDTPYNAAEELQLGGMLQDMNEQPLALIIHVGDFKSSQVECTDAVFEERRRWFSEVEHPFIYVPGDNEWTDCETARRPRDALERLAKLRELFFSTGSTLGKVAFPLEQQSARGYAEHVRWIARDVVFATFNIPGPDNHAARMPQESRDRTRAVLDWMQQTFELARERRLPAVVLAMHGNIFTGRSGYGDILSALEAHARRYQGEILVIHGDTHWFHFDRPLADRNVANLRRLEVFGSPFSAWTLVTVTIENGHATFHATHGSATSSEAQPAAAER